jgi:hypothetical protein
MILEMAASAQHSCVAHYLIKSAARIPPTTLVDVISMNGYIIDGKSMPR